MKICASEAKASNGLQESLHQKQSLSKLMRAWIPEPDAVFCVHSQSDLNCVFYLKIFLNTDCIANVTWRDVMRIICSRFKALFVAV